MHKQIGNIRFGVGNDGVYVMTRHRVFGCNYWARKYVTIRHATLTLLKRGPLFYMWFQSPAF